MPTRVIIQDPNTGQESELDSLGRLPVAASIDTVGIYQMSSASGCDIRYEMQDKLDLPKKNQAFAVVYEVIEKSIFYKIIFQLNSDNIYMQVEIDGQDIFPGSNGFCFEDLQDLSLGSGGRGSGRGGKSGSGVNPLGLFEYDNNKWLWEPPRPLYIGNSMKIKMKASTNSLSRDYKKGIVVRRRLV